MCLDLKSICQCTIYVSLNSLAPAIPDLFSWEMKRIKGSYKLRETIYLQVISLAHKNAWVTVTTLLYYICGSHCAAGKQQLYWLKETSLLAPIYHVSPTEMYSLCDNIFLPCENTHNSVLSIHLWYLITDAACVLLSWQKILVTVTIMEEINSFVFAKERKSNSKV